MKLDGRLTNPEDDDEDSEDVDWALDVSGTAYLIGAGRGVEDTLGALGELTFSATATLSAAGHFAVMSVAVTVNVDVSVPKTGSDAGAGDLLSVRGALDVSWPCPDSGVMVDGEVYFELDTPFAKATPGLEGGEGDKSDKSATLFFGCAETRLVVTGRMGKMDVGVEGGPKLIFRNVVFDLDMHAPSQGGGGGGGNATPALGDSASSVFDAGTLYVRGNMSGAASFAKTGQAEMSLAEGGDDPADDVTRNPGLSIDMAVRFDTRYPLATSFFANVSHRVGSSGNESGESYTWLYGQYDGGAACRQPTRFVGESHFVGFGLEVGEGGWRSGATGLALEATRHCPDPEQGGFTLYTFTARAEAWKLLKGVFEVSRWK